MITCTRRLTFCAGHRVAGHENKCAHLHGHNYVVYVMAEAPLDELGRVIDFAVLKEKIGGWIDEHWDHGFILSKDDAHLIAMFKEINVVLRRGQRLYVLPYNPTAENLARHILEFVCPQMLNGTGVEVTRVRVEETENCAAEASL